MERVSVLKPKTMGPTLLVAPHGFDDQRTGEIVMEASKQLRCSAIVNWGYRKAADPDYFANEVDCNNLEHLSNTDVAEQEFLNPFLSCAYERVNTSGEGNIYLIHGMHNPKSGSFDVVVGCGEEGKKSASCEDWRRDALLYALGRNSLRPQKAKMGGLYAGASKRNLNQTFRTSGVGNRTQSIQSFQLEFVRDTRNTDAEAIETANRLVMAITIHKAIIQAEQGTAPMPTGIPANWRSLVSQVDYY